MEQKKPTELNNRYYLLDSLRGICILGMIIYHTLFDAVAFFGADITENMLTAVNVIRDFGACIFICLSGICIHFGKKPVKRILLISGAGLIVSIVTALFMPELPVVFGILTFMGIAALIMLPLKKVFMCFPPLISAVICFLLFLLTFEANDRYVGYYGLYICDMPEFLYQNYLTAFLGFPFYGFKSSDYYPLFPWIFMFFFGFFLWRILASNEKILKILDFRIKFLEKTGKYSLYIYMAHQPVILGVFMLINLIMKYVGSVM